MLKSIKKRLDHNRNKQTLKQAARPELYSLLQGRFIHFATDSNQEVLICERFVSFTYTINKNKAFFQYTDTPYSYTKPNKVSISLAV
jgi:hypothetical protein